MIVGAHGPVMIDGSATVCGPQPAGIKSDTVTLEKTAPGQSRQGVSANVTSGALAFPLLVLEELGLALVFSAVARASAAFSSWCPLCCCAWPSLRR